MTYGIDNLLKDIQLANIESLKSNLTRIREIVNETGPDPRPNHLGTPTRPLTLACHSGNAEVVGLLIDAGAEDKDSDALFAATYQNDVAALDRLIAAGANVNASAEGKTHPLHVAAANGCAEAIKRLIAAGAYVDCVDRFESTPLHVAAIHDQGDAIEALAAGKANLHARDDRGKTPLHVAAESGMREAVRRLAAVGACLDAMDETREGSHTALHNVMVYNNIAMALLLIEVGARVSLLDAAAIGLD